jgi:hypothetical protein
MYNVLDHDQGLFWLKCNGPNCNSAYGTDDDEYDEVDELESDAINDGWLVDIGYENGQDSYRTDFCCEQCEREFDYEYYDDD